MDKIKDTPLVPPVSPITRMEQGDNDTLQNSERKRSENPALAATFSAQTAPDEQATRDASTEEPVVLIYNYDRRAQQIKLIKN